MVSGEQGRGPGVGKAPSQRCMSDLVVNIGGKGIHGWPRDTPGGRGKGNRGERTELEYRD